MEKNMEPDMDTDLIWGYIGIVCRGPNDLNTVSQYVIPRQNGDDNKNFSILRASTSPR